ncbi:MAG: Hsp70 family protein, partial [Planctomycetota bacterium]
DKSFIVLDKHSGARKEHRQRWHVTDVAAFIIRDVIRRAEETIGEKITQVVATYPTLFSRDRKDAVKRAFQLALEAGGAEIDESSVIMNLDETSAAAFNYIKGTLLPEFQKFSTAMKKTCQLLVYDFGGGTIDVSLVAVDISRDSTGRLSIETELKGLTGESYYGGDNVTLAVFKILKKKLALQAAKSLNEKYEEDRKTVAAKEEEDIDPFSAKVKKKAEEEEEEWDPFAAAAKDKKQEAEVTTSDEDTEGLEDIINMHDQNIWRQAVETVWRERSIIEKSILEGSDILKTVIVAEEKDGSFIAKDQSQRRAELLEKAIETLLPTKWAEYEDKDPMHSELARKLFYEIWHEGDLLKIRLSKGDKGTAKLSGVLRKIAKYIGVDSIVFNEVFVTMDELNKHIEKSVSETVKKAYNLVLSIREEEKGGIAIRRGTAETPELRVILCGNSSNLPIVKQKVIEIFKINEKELFMNKSELKTGTAVGACEEYMLRRDFGESGLIQYSSRGFLERLPCSIGLFHPDLILQGYEKGFCPIFPRGTEVGTQKVLDSKNYFLIHQKMGELSLYADYYDGALPAYIGWFDFTAPDGELEEFTPEPDAEEVMKVRIELIPNRDIRAVNLRNGKYYNLKPKKEGWKPDEYPFSGIH